MNRKQYQGKEQIQLLSNHQGIFFDDQLKEYLFHKHKIYSKSVGIDKSTKTMAKFTVPPYLLNKFSVCYLIEAQPQMFVKQDLAKPQNQHFKQMDSSLPYRVFSHLKQKYFLIDGHKFGSQFLAYDKDPQTNHATALIFCGLQQQIQSQRNHLTRLAQIAKKQCMFAFVNDESEEISLVKLQREVQKEQTTKRQKKKKKISGKDIQKKDKEQG